MWQSCLANARAKHLARGPDEQSSGGYCFRPTGIAQAEDVAIRDAPSPLQRMGKSSCATNSSRSSPRCAAGSPTRGTIGAGCDRLVMRALAVGEIVEPRHPHYRPGEIVMGWFGWRELATVEAARSSAAPSRPTSLRRRSSSVSKSSAMMRRSTDRLQGARARRRDRQKPARPRARLFSTTRPGSSTIGPIRGFRLGRVVILRRRLDLHLGPLADRTSDRTISAGQARPRGGLRDPGLRGSMANFGCDAGGPGCAQASCET